MLMLLFIAQEISISGVFTQNLMESTKDKKLSSIFQNKIINGVTIKDQKPSRKLQNKRINGVAEKFSQGSATTKPVSATCSPGDMYYYPVKNVQVSDYTLYFPQRSLTFW